MSWKEPRYDTLTWIDSRRYRRHSMVWGRRGKLNRKTFQPRQGAGKGSSEMRRCLPPLLMPSLDATSAGGGLLGRGPSLVRFRRLLQDALSHPHQTSTETSNHFSRHPGAPCRREGLEICCSRFSHKPVLQNREERWVWVCVCVEDVHTAYQLNRAPLETRTTMLDASTECVEFPFPSLRGTLCTPEASPLRPNRQHAIAPSGERERGNGLYVCLCLYVCMYAVRIA